jgi:hypothetical protein
MTTVLDGLMAAMRRMEADFAAIGDADDDDANMRRGQLFLESAAYLGYMALVTVPGAQNYVVCSIRFEDAEDPRHAAMSFEARWRSGKTPDEVIKEKDAEISRLRVEWAEMKVERDEARAAPTKAGEP